MCEVKLHLSLEQEYRAYIELTIIDLKLPWQRHEKKAVQLALCILIVRRYVISQHTLSRMNCGWSSENWVLIISPIAEATRVSCLSASE